MSHLASWSLSIAIYSMDKNIFLSLSPELILAICEELDLNDLKHLRLTCKTLADDVVSLALSHIRIPAKAVTTIEEIISDLQLLTKPERAAVHCTRKITFCKSSSIFGNSEDTASDTTNGNVDDMKRVNQDFLKLLASFKAVRAVNWYACESDSLWLQETIWSSIKTYPNLRHLTISASFLNQPLRGLDSLNTLESITILDSIFKHKGALFLSLSKLYAASSNLNSITIENLDDYDSECHDLEDLFTCSPGGNRANHLRHLALSDISLSPDQVVLSHLTHLTSFKISLFFNKPLDSPYGDIWVAFRRSRIRLEELEVGGYAIRDSLYEYLSSFSGLKKLKMEIPSFNDHASSAASAVKFWSSFPHHVETLRVFTLHAHYDDQWCFGSHNRSLIAKCTKLEELTMSPLDLPEDIPISESDFNGINVFIDTVVTSMPQITSIGLEVPSREGYRHEMCGTHSYRTLNHDRYQLMGWIPKYKAPASCQRLPLLTVGPNLNRVFVGVRNDGSGGLLSYHQLSVPSEAD